MIDYLPLFLNKFSFEYLIRKDIIHVSCDVAGIITITETSP